MKVCSYADGEKEDTNYSYKEFKKGHQYRFYTHLKHKMIL